MLRCSTCGVQIEDSIEAVHAHVVAYPPPQAHHVLIAETEDSYTYVTAKIGSAGGKVEPRAYTVMVVGPCASCGRDIAVPSRICGACVAEAVL